MELIFIPVNWRNPMNQKVSRPRNILGHSCISIILNPKTPFWNLYNFRKTDLSDISKAFILILWYCEQKEVWQHLLLLDCVAQTLFRCKRILIYFFFFFLIWDCDNYCRIDAWIVLHIQDCLTRFTWLHNTGSCRAQRKKGLPISQLLSFRRHSVAQDLS